MTKAAPVQTRLSWLPTTSECDWDCAVACLLTVFLLVCHGIRFASAGGLWRDEANSVYLATEVTPVENWQRLHLDSSPAAWFVVLRTWNALGYGGSDIGWRMLGLAIGMASVGLAWMASRVLSAPAMRRSPMVMLLLIGFSPEVMQTGDSIRAYGLGICCTFVVTAVTWQALRNPAKGRWLAAAAAYCLAVHVHFQAVPAVLTLGMASACLGAWRKSMWQTLAPLVAGGSAGCTLLIYRPMFAGQRDVADFLAQPFQPLVLVSRLLDSLTRVGFDCTAAGHYADAGQKVAAACIWTCFLALAAIPPVSTIVKRLRQRSFVEPGASLRADMSRDSAGELRLFVLICLGIYVPVYVGLLVFRGWVPAPHHYLLFIAFTGLFIDCGLRCRSSGSGRGLLWLPLVVLFLSAWCGSAVVAAARTRATNIDLAARVINERAKATDLVLVAPWEVGVSFRRYCRPGVNWCTLPPVADHTVHRYDLLLKVLSNPSYGAEMQAMLRRELASGGDVWYVGSDLRIVFPENGQVASVSGGPFSIHAVQALGGSFGKIERLPDVTVQPVSEYENAVIYRFQRSQ